MVISAENPTPPPDPMAETASAPARSLHNFSSFPILKTWGNRKFLRCLNVNRKGETIRSPSPPSPLPAQPPAQASPSSESPSPPRSKDEQPDEDEDDDDESLERLRDKLFGHYQQAVHHINLVSKSPARTAPEPPPASPWNLRTRRAAPARDPSLSPPPRPPTRARPPAEAAGSHARTVRLRSEAVEKKEEPPRPRFSISLSAREVDEDIYALTGSRARRRPRKRPRAVQKQLDMLFPGAWLTEITADTYKVPE